MSFLPALAGAQTLEEAIEFHAAGQYAEALEAYSVVAQSQERSDPWAAAIANNNSCGIYMNRGDYPSALQVCLAAFRLIQTLDDDRLRSRNLNNLGVVNQHLGRYEESEGYFQQALELNRARGDQQGQVINLSNFGALATEAGWYARAIDAHLSAEAVAREHDEEPWAAEQIRIAQINRGVVLEKLGEFDQALDLYQQVLAHSNEVNPWRVAPLTVNMGVTYRNLGDPVKAAQAFERAIQIYEELGDASGLSNAHLNLALTRHLNLGQLEAAERSYERALQLARESGDRTQEIQDLFYMGRLLSDLGRPGEAEQAFELCLAASEESGAVEGQWSALAGLGKTNEEKGDLERALSYYERAMDVIEDVRSDLGESSHRSGFFGDKRPIFGAAVEVLAALQSDHPNLGYAEVAFEVVQRAKARQLLDALGPESRPAIPETAEAVRGRLGTSTLLEYFVGEDTILLWVVDANGMRMIDAGPSGPLLSRVSQIHGSLARGEAPNERVLKDLSDALLGPAESELERSSSLRISPDGRLHYLPFELLPHPGSSDELVVDRLPVSYLPSASILAWLEDSRRLPGRAFLGFGNPTLLDDAPELPTRLLVSRFNLGELPQAGRELASAQRWLDGPGESWIGEDLTEENFRRAVAEGARVVHLATHAVVDERPGRGAAIVFTPAGNDDGLLYTGEIAGVEYRAGLTVLASCRTALGSPEDGLALTTLTGSFLAAGSSAVMATLWDVEDAASAAFMEQFYFELGRGTNPAIALARAKLRMREDTRWNRPSVWAAYVLIGETPPLVVRRLIPAWALLFAGLLLALGAWKYLTRKYLTRA